MHSLHPLINWSILFSRPRLSFQQSRQRKLVQQENCAGRKCIPFIHLSIGAGRKLSLLSLFSDSHLLFESNVITYQQRVLCIAASNHSSFHFHFPFEASFSCHAFLLLPILCFAAENGSKVIPFGSSSYHNNLIGCNNLPSDNLDEALT